MDRTSSNKPQTVASRVESKRTASSKEVDMLGAFDGNELRVSHKFGLTIRVQWPHSPCTINGKGRFDVVQKFMQQCNGNVLLREMHAIPDISLTLNSI